MADFRFDCVFYYVSDLDRAIARSLRRHGRTSLLAVNKVDKPGDPVVFRLTVTDTDSWIDKLKKTSRSAPAEPPKRESVRLARAVDELKVGADGSLEILERIEGGRHQVSRCAGPPALLGWATGNLPDMWKPFTIIDAVMGVLFVWAYVVLGKPAEKTPPNN